MTMLRKEIIKVSAVITHTHAWFGWISFLDEYFIVDCRILKMKGWLHLSLLFLKTNWKYLFSFRDMIKLLLCHHRIFRM